jgi:hypothetical protein
MLNVVIYPRKYIEDLWEEIFKEYKMNLKGTEVREYQVYVIRIWNNDGFF